ncbi:hypothetical protein DH2020_001255 [Rehmannia glutinosa]|uniref:Protein kinase domain-containing protein n=1 Tax=Rehmannia glutinosa TaxID=99300 RepID=A0ABR0XYU5_REHGL
MESTRFEAATNFLNPSTHKLRDQAVKCDRKHEFRMFCLFLWLIWGERNNVFHGKKARNCEAVISVGQAWLETFDKAQVSVVLSSREAVAGANFGWKGKGAAIMLGSYGVMRQCGTTSLDWEGGFLVKKLPGTFNSLTAEALALRYGLRFARDNNLLLEKAGSDSLNLIKGIVALDPHDPNGVIFENISSLLDFLGCNSCFHIPRENNVIAHRLAKWATESPVSILLSIKASLIDPLNRLTDWKPPLINTSSTHCNWTGIQCSSNGDVEKLDLSHMNLTGEIPDEIQRLKSLNSLNLCCNLFSSPLPKSLSNLTSLQTIDLSQNFFINQLFPAGLSPGLIAINASGITSPVIFGRSRKRDPARELGSERKLLRRPNSKTYKKLKKLKYLGLSGNNLTGLIPQSSYLDLAIANLSGSIPGELGKLKKLDTIFLYKNNFEGNIPPEIGNLTALQFLDLSDNLLSGEIQGEIADLENLQLLNLMCNHLSGSIPIGIGKLSQLEVFELWNNTFWSSAERSWRKRAPVARYIVNSFSAKFETDSNDLSASTSLSSIDLSKNHLRSSLPSSILSIPNLQNFLASGNDLFGEIPDQFQDCPGLSVLDLSSNHFTGNIPASIAVRKISDSKSAKQPVKRADPKTDRRYACIGCFGSIKQFSDWRDSENFGNSPALEMLNVSYNRLEGPSLNAMLRTINPDDLIGNPGLCGGFLPPCSQNSAFTSKQHGLQGKHVVSGLIIGISTLFVLVIAVFGARSFYQRWRDGNCFEERFDTGNGEWPWRLMAFQRLDFNSNDILNCIKESNVIGMGATGTVYKAEIQRLNTTVAVKKLWRSPTSDPEMGSSDYFVGEVNLLGRLRHRNVVRLLGFLHNDADSMIIYKYMQNGSLGEALHGKKGGNLLVDWVSRYNIAVGVAQGLAYLHHDCHPPVIHRDVKSNNILLDANLEARIADFGLAKMMLKKNETVSMVAGSYGYIAPEYGYTLKVDEKSDIYSYGVVLMELLTGKRPLEPEFGESVDIVEWIRRKMRSNKPLEEALDPNVGNNKHVQEEMLLVLRFAIICTAKNPKDRPSMRDVLSMLGEAKPRRKSSTVDEDNNGNANRDRPVFSNSPVNGLL